MKNSNKVTLLLPLFFAIAFLNCNKMETFGDGRAENLPASVNLGESQIFVNGEQVDFSSNFIKFKHVKPINCSFLNDKNGVTGDLQFAIRIFEPHTIPGAKFGFSRSQGDNNFESYNQIGIDSSILEITKIDTVALEISGRFEARFKKSGTAPVTRKKRYPNEIFIQGVFNEKYVVF